MTATFYHYAGCSTCRRAKKDLDAQGIALRLVDIVASPPGKAELVALHRRSGLPIAKLFNRSGQSYKAGGFKDRLPEMSEDEALAALAADGKLIKRPILVIGERVLVGYRPSDYASLSS